MKRYDCEMSTANQKKETKVQLVKCIGHKCIFMGRFWMGKMQIWVKKKKKNEGNVMYALWLLCAEVR